jgi:hypothetical protein
VMRLADGYLPKELSVRIRIRTIRSANTCHIQRQLVLVLSMHHLGAKDLRKPPPAFQGYGVAVSIDLLFTSQPLSEIKSCKTLCRTQSDVVENSGKGERPTSAYSEIRDEIDGASP